MADTRDEALNKADFSVGPSNEKTWGKEGGKGDTQHRLEDTHPVSQNVETIMAMEDQARQKHTLSDHLSDAISTFAGSMNFVLCNAVLFAVWVMINSGVIPIVEPFDEYPFTFLTFVVSLEAIFLSTFVLMSQNRMTRQADQRAHLNLQIDMLAEQESTKTLEMLQTICAHLGIDEYRRDEGAQQMMKETQIETLSSDIEERLSNN